VGWPVGPMLREEGKMSPDNKRRSERVIPFVSDEEVVVIRGEGKPPVLAKMMDLSETGTLVYLLAEADVIGCADTLTNLAVYHQGKVFEIPSTVARKDGRMIAFHFNNPPEDVLRDVQGKLIRMEIEWMRLSRRS
jgi:hypothetical protein